MASPWGAFFGTLGDELEQLRQQQLQKKKEEEERKRLEGQRKEDVEFRNRNFQLDQDRFNFDKETAEDARRRAMREFLGPGEVDPDTAGKLGPYAKQEGTLPSTQYFPQGDTSGMPEMRESESKNYFYIPANFLERRQMEQDRITGQEHEANQRLRGVQTRAAERELNAPDWYTRNKIEHDQRMQEINASTPPRLDPEQQLALDILKAQKPDPTEDPEAFEQWLQKVQQFITQNKLDKYLTMPDTQPPPFQGPINQEDENPFSQTTNKPSGVRDMFNKVKEWWAPGDQPVMPQGLVGPIPSPPGPLNRQRLNEWLEGYKSSRPPDRRFQR